MLEKGNAIRILCVPGSRAICRADWSSTSTLNADALSNPNLCMICSRTGAIVCSSKCSKMYFLTFFWRFVNSKSRLIRRHLKEDSTVLPEVDRVEVVPIDYRGHV